MKKILYLEDLINFCDNNKMCAFSSSETGYSLCVHVPAEFSKCEEDDEFTMFGTVKLMHTGKNRNRSSLTEKAAKSCLSSIAYKPLLANFCEVDGVKDFASHDFYTDDDGNIVYLERQIGCFTADKPYIEVDKENNDRQYIYAKVAIPREYTDATKIIERKGGTKISAELAINKMSYDVEEKVLVLEDVTVMGATCLGINPSTGEDVQEGMEGARLDIEDFSIDNNSLKYEEDSKLIDLMSKLEEVIDKINILNDCGKEEEQMENENMNMEEEVVIEKESTEEVASVEETPEVVELDNEVTDTVVDEESIVEIEEESDAVEETFEESKSISYSINGKNFETSLNDIQHALVTLVNDTYAESDNAWYDVIVYSDSKYVVMRNLWVGNAYKQSYKVRNDIYSLVGDRIPVKAIYVTADEEKELDKMRSSYAELADKLGKYEEEPQKLAILNSSDYANIAETDEFIAIKERDAYFNLSIDELKEKCDTILLEFAKGHKVEFSSNEEKAEVKKFGNANRAKKKGRYGSLFAK